MQVTTCAVTETQSLFVIMCVGGMRAKRASPGKIVGPWFIDGKDSRDVGCSPALWRRCNRSPQADVNYVPESPISRAFLGSI
jgi:hypothetical protein